MQANGTPASAGILPPNGASVLPGGFIELSGDLIPFMGREAALQIGDRLEHAHASQDIEAALPKMALAFALFRASESGILDAADLECTVRLADIAAYIAEAREEFADDLDATRANAQAYIVGRDQGKRFTTETDDQDPNARAENIAEYRRCRLSARANIACCDVILDVIGRARNGEGEDG